MRRTTALPALAVLAAASVGCGGPPSTGDFRDEAQQFINGDLNENPLLNGLSFSDAECQEPETTKTGTAFTCTANASDGEPRTLSVTIAGRNQFEIKAEGIQPPLPEGPTAGAPASSTPAAPATTTPAAG